MKNFIIALILTVGYVIACVYFSNVVCVQILSFLSVVLYALGMGTLAG